MSVSRVGDKWEQPRFFALGDVFARWWLKAKSVKREEHGSISCRLTGLGDVEINGRTLLLCHQCRVCRHQSQASNRPPQALANERPQGKPLRRFGFLPRTQTDKHVWRTFESSRRVGKRCKVAKNGVNGGGRSETTDACGDSGGRASAVSSPPLRNEPLLAVQL
jgi:hypothetical protein